VRQQVRAKIQAQDVDPSPRNPLNRLKGHLAIELKLIRHPSALTNNPTVSMILEKRNVAVAIERIPHHLRIADCIKAPENRASGQGKNNEWFTPAQYVELAREVLGAFDLDPASCEIANRTVKAAKFYSLEDDGLKYEWHGRVWMNPPWPKFFCLLNRTIAALLSRQIR